MAMAVIALAAALYFAWALVKAASAFDQAFNIEYTEENMNTKELADKISGIEYGRDFSKIMDRFGQEAKSSGLVIVFGESDDLMEFRGAIHEDLGAWEGATAYLTSEGLLKNKCEDSDCPYFEKSKAQAETIIAQWCADNDCVWTYKTDIPCERFDVVEYGGLYCRGIVFAMSDLKGGA